MADLPEWFEKTMREQLPDAEPALVAARELLGAVLRAEEAMTAALRPTAGRVAPLAAHSVITSIAGLGYQLSAREENRLD